MYIKQIKLYVQKCYHKINYSCNQVGARTARPYTNNIYKRYAFVDYNHYERQHKGATPLCHIAKSANAVSRSEAKYLRHWHLVH